MNQHAQRPGRKPRQDGAQPRRSSTRRLLLAGVVAVALFGAGSVAVVVLSDGTPARPPAEAAPVAAPAAPVAEPPPAVAEAVKPPEQRPAPPPYPKAPPLEKPPPIKRPPHRIARGSPAPVDLFAGVRGLGDAVRARCPRSAPAAVPAAARGARPATTFLLDFETGPHRARVVDASVWQRGDADDAFLACATDVLMGRDLPVQAAEPGTRFQMPVELGR